MASVFRVPGSWDGLYLDVHSQYSKRSSKLYESEKSFDSGQSHLRLFDQVSLAPSSLSYESGDSGYSSNYKNFVDLARMGTEKTYKTHRSAMSKASVKLRNKSLARHERKDPIIVTLEHKPEDIYQFPYEYAELYSGFKQSLREAFPRYRKLIEIDSFVLVNEKDSCIYIPKHYEAFIGPGQTIAVRFQKPPRKVPEKRHPRRAPVHKPKYDEFEEEDEEEEEEEDEDHGRGRKKKGWMSWLTSE